MTLIVKVKQNETPLQNLIETSSGHHCPALYTYPSSGLEHRRGMTIKTFTKSPSVPFYVIMRTVQAANAFANTSYKISSLILNLPDSFMTQNTDLSTHKPP